MKHPEHLHALLYRALVLAVIIGVLHHAAFVWYWYWTLWWFDIVMHILGSIFLGLVLYWSYRRFRTISMLFSSTGAQFLFIVFGTLAIGVGWEVFEYLSGMFVEGGIFPDTVFDLFADTAGALIAYGYAHLHQQGDGA